MRYITYIFWFIIILLGIVFAVINSHSVTINLYAGDIECYLPLLLIILLALGAILGVIALMPALLRAKARNRKLKQRIKQSEQEVKNLRAIPIKDEH